MFLRESFVIFCLILSFNFSALGAENQCLNLLSKPSIGPRNLETLIEKMEQLGIRLELREISDLHESANQDFFEIHAYDRTNELVGEISMVQMDQSLFLQAGERPLYTSHIQIPSNGGLSLRGVGLGTYLYTAASWAIYRTGGVLFSSTGPSSKAIDAWERMVSQGWAVRGTERDDELLQINDPDLIFSSYRFDYALLEEGYFDDLDDVVEDPDMIFVRYY